MSNFDFFGRFILDKRIPKNLSAKELALAVECTPSFIRAIERGDQFPSTEMACKILEVLGVEYSVIDPLTIKLNNGRKFQFSASIRGQNRRGRQPSFRFIQEARISALEKDIAELKKFVYENIRI